MKKTFLIIIVVASIQMVGGTVCLGSSQSDDYVKSKRTFFDEMGDSNLENRNNGFNENRTKFFNDPDFVKDKETEGKLIVLLKEAHQKFEIYITNFTQHGERYGKAEDLFIHENPAFFNYISNLTENLVRFKDVDTIPLILKTDSYFPSDKIGIGTYFSFGKAAFWKILGEIKNTTPLGDRHIYYLRLTEWVNRTILNIEIDPSLRLDPEELEQAKNTIIAGSMSSKINENLYANCSLPYLITNEKNVKEKQRLKEVLIRTLSHKDGGIRENGVKALGDIGDLSDISELEKLKTDPEVDSKTRRKRHEKALAPEVTDSATTYPVREAATKAIEKIKARYKDMK